MNKSSWMGLALLASLGAGCRPGTDPNVSEPRSSTGVVGSDQAPGVVALLTPDQRIFCTGAIIGDRWVLTANRS